VKIHPFEAEFLHVDGEKADIMKLIVAFYQFCEGPKNRVKFSPDDLLVFLFLEFVTGCPMSEIRP
jgi:hypothetical protein